MERSALKRLVTLFPRKTLLVTGIIATIIISILSVVFGYILKPLIDAAVDGNSDIFMNVLILTSALVLSQVLLQFLKTRMLGGYTESGLKVLRHQFASKMNTISVDAMQTSHSGDMLSRGTNDMNRVRNFTLSLLPRLIEIPLSATLALWVLLFLSWKLTLITLALIPVLVIGSTLLSRPIAALSMSVQQRLGRVNQTVTDFIKGVEVSKAYTLEDALENKHDKAVEGSVEGGKKLAKRRALLEVFSMVFSILPFIVTFVLGGYFVIQGEMTMGGLLAFITLLNLLTFPLSQMSVMIGEAKRDMASAERIFETIDADDERQEGDSFTFSHTSPLIAFKDLTFTYPGDKDPVINRLTLEIEPGETVAFVGPSGGGKSTVIKLVMGYYDTYTGSLKFSGHELRDWHLSSLREHLALVSQDTFLFPESIRENIAHGNEEASFEAVMDAAEKAFADSFINELDNGYDTSLGELGDSLSGGQKQRIAIARAMLKNAHVLLLDEATSALDTESEKMIQQALEPFMKTKTSIIIAHRLSTIKNVDRIVVISEGKIKEQGTHQALLKAGGLYQSLYNEELRKGEKRDEDQDL